GELMGLKAVPPADRPNVAVVFFSFRIMVGIGVLMIIIALTGNYLRLRGRLYQSKRFLTLCSYLAPSGVLAVLAGWYVVEVGRQPWLVQGLIRTKDVVTPLPPERVLFSLSLFIITYSLLFAVYLYFMRKLIRKGPPPLSQLKQQLIGVKAAGYAAALAKQLPPNQEAR
ncbi:MAG: cytochrome ubiquinol oxidase subunit I, partial [Rheinheimera sp.]|nr:cytochrome ubiquinol oxidase subunit I [Rheinheimera sp.]